MYRTVAILTITLGACLLMGCGRTDRPGGRPAASQETGITADAAAVDRASQLLDAGNLEEAEGQLQPLEARLDALPADLQARVRAIRTSLDARRVGEAARKGLGAATRPDANADRTGAEHAIAEARRAAAEVNRHAESLLARALSFIDAGKLDDAEEMLATLEQNLAALSPEIQGRITAARTALAARKSAGGAVSPPTMPALP